MPSPGTTEDSSNDSSLVKVGLYISAFIIFTLAALKLCKRQKHFEVPARDISKGHKWSYDSPFMSPVYCNVCEMLIVDGFKCDCCSIYADRCCISKANRFLVCKSLATHGSTMKHHWIKGNLPCENSCLVCGEECGMEPGLTDFYCCWCWLATHVQCLESVDGICTLGPFRDFIVPPHHVKLKQVGWKGRRHLIVGEVKPVMSSSWSPLIVIANRKSGSNDGESVLRAFRGILNPAQVIDLHDLPPESGLEWCHLVPDHICRVLVAGGDGTIGWVLSAISKLQLRPKPHVAIVPLGTGNDLSRILGWGNGSGSSYVKPNQILAEIEKADVVNLDRWKLTITPHSHLGLRLPRKHFYVNNYTSIGVDALVTLNFHNTRESRLYLVGNRLLNKLLFVSYGTKDFWERQCKNLNQKLELYLDDRRVQLPDVEGIVFLNIPYWGAGVRPWTLGTNSTQVPDQKMDDGLLEVFGIYSSFHIAQMQIGLSEPLRLGQARTVHVRLLEKMPMQVDGEPWEQLPGKIDLKFYDQASMLSCSSQS